MSRENLGAVYVCTFGTESSKSAVLTSCRGYRSEEYPEGIDVDTAILKDLNSVVNELRNNSYVTLPSYDLDYYTANLAKLETNINTYQVYTG